MEVKGRSCNLLFMLPGQNMSVVAGALHMGDGTTSFYSIQPITFPNFSHQKSKNTCKWNLFN